MTVAGVTEVRSGGHGTGASGSRWPRPCKNHAERRTGDAWWEAPLREAEIPAERPLCRTPTDRSGSMTALDEVAALSPQT